MFLIADKLQYGQLPIVVLKRIDDNGICKITVAEGIVIPVTKVPLPVLMLGIAGVVDFVVVATVTLLVVTLEADRADYELDEYKAVEGADAVVVMTDWSHYPTLDWQKIFDSMRKPALVFDTRNCLDRGKLKDIGFKVIFASGRKHSFKFKEFIIRLFSLV